MFDKIFDIIPFSVFLLFFAVITPLVIVGICWLILAVLQGISPTFIWKWMLREQNWNSIRHQVQSYKEGKICRPLFVGLALGMLFASILLVSNLLKENIFYLLIYYAGLVVGIVWQIFYLKNHGNEMDSNRK